RTMTTGAAGGEDLGAAGGERAGYRGVRGAGAALCRRRAVLGLGHQQHHDDEHRGHEREHFDDVHDLAEHRLQNSGSPTLREKQNALVNQSPMSVTNPTPPTTGSSQFGSPRTRTARIFTTNAP